MCTCRYIYIYTYIYIYIYITFSFDKKSPVSITLVSAISAYIHILVSLLPTGCEERGVLGFWSMPVANLSSCQDIKAIALYCIHMNIVGW